MVEPHGRRPAAWLVFLGWMVGLTAAYSTAGVVGPGWLSSGPVYNLIGASSVCALLLGAGRRPRGRRLPWLLVAAGQALFVAGDVLAYNYERFFAGELPFPSIADACYLAFYPLLVAGLVLLLRQRGGARDRGSLVDALTITIGLAALSWTYLMSPYAHDPSLSLPTKGISIAYPLMDVLVLSVLARLAVAHGRRAVGFVVLAVGTTALLATDAVYGWMLLHGGYEPGGLLDIGWSAFYAFMGVAALHPSTLPAAEGEIEVLHPRLTGKRIAVLGGASLVTPALVLTHSFPADSALDVKLLAVASAAMFVLVLIRMAGLMQSREAAVRREAERTAQLTAAERSAKAKDAFVSQVSHELRTPLTSILGYLSLLEEEGEHESDPGERAAYLAVVTRNTDRLLRLVNDLLLIARMDDGKLVLEEAEFDLAGLAADGVEAARPAAEKRRVALSLSAPPTLALRGDGSRVAQVIDNLLSNAIKFTPEGGRVELDVARANGTATLVVADTGIGMSADELAHLFERFYRTDAATNGAIQGTGLGLSITKAIVEAHGGTISAASEPGRGTSLTVRLPVA